MREQILRTIVAVLGGDGTPAAAVFRCKVDQIRTDGDDSELPCYDVATGAEKDADVADHDTWGRSLAVTVRAIAESQDDATGDAALDPLYLFAVRSLMEDETFGGLAISTDWTGTDEPVFRPDGRSIIGVALTFDVKFAVRRGDPAQKG